MKEFKYFSLFSGIGGLEWGLKDIARCVGWSEIRKSSCRIYERYNPDIKNYGDITKISFETLPDFDILTGGFPCQSFSLLGLRDGFNSERGKMIFYIYDLLKAKSPKFLVLENVKGIVNHRKGKTLEDVMRLLTFAGYYVRIVLLNSLHYGIAQNRERVFFLGSKVDFPIKIPVMKDSTKRFRDVREVDVVYKFVKESAFEVSKLEQKRVFNYELIGGYDCVGTLTTQKGCGEKRVYNEKEGRYRYLTLKECERLQGFPDDYTVGVSDASRYWALGNAVNCNVSNYLFNEYLAGLWW